MGIDYVVRLCPVSDGAGLTQYVREPTLNQYLLVRYDSCLGIPNARSLLCGEQPLSIIIHLWMSYNQ